MVHYLQDKRRGLISGVRASVRNKPRDHVTERDLELLESIQAPHDFGLHQQATADRDRQIAIDERRAAFARQQEDRERGHHGKRPVESGEESPRKRRGSDAS